MVTDVAQIGAKPTKLGTLDEEQIAKLNEMLKALGYNIAEIGSTEAAAQKFHDDFLQEPDDFFGFLNHMMANLVLMFSYGTSVDELLEKTMGVANHATKVENVPEPMLRSGVDFASDEDPFVAAAKKAMSLVGQRESGGDNHGAVVRLVANGQEGQAWCGYFINYLYDKGVGMPQLFDQGDHSMAKSFMREAKDNGAFHTSGYTPRVGDLVVLDRGGDKGHVGIVTAVEDGHVTYVSGNDGNAVKARSFPIDSPPAQFMGYADVRALAENKNVPVPHKEQLVASNDASVDVPVTAFAKGGAQGMMQG